MRRLPALLVFLASAFRSADAQDQADPGKPRIEWTDDLPEAMARGAREGKPLVVCFVAGWCSVCAGFESGALKSPQVNALADRFVWVKIDVERSVSLVRTYQVRATPRIDFLDAGGHTRVRISGALPSTEFREQLDGFLTLLQANTAPGLREIDGSSYTTLSDTPAGYRGLSICFSNVGYGPLRLGSQSPFQAIRFGMDPRTPSTLAEGQWEARVTESWSNAFIYDADNGLLVDYEMLDTRVAVAFGVIDELELELEYENRSAFGGVLDRFINAFHRTFGLTDAGRHNFPRNQFQIQIPDSKGTPTVDFDNSDRGSFSNSLLLTVQHNVSCGTEYLPAFAYALTLRADLDTTVGLSGGLWVEPQLSVSASKAIGDFYLYGSVAFAWFGTQHQGGIRYRTTQLSGLGALEWRFDSAMSLILQYLVSQGAVDSLGPFSTNSHEITLGWKWEIAPLVVFEFGLIENLINFSNSPDFGLHFGLSYRF
ncbi:MAG TPA: DUF3187 family protein [Planctomycetota bacterium]|nr:DUF3187 family protein [Planctomycetota bacterium]